MKKILVPTDFSAQADIATDVALEIAKKLLAEVVLLHVIEQPQSSSFNVMGEVAHDQEWEDKLFMLKLIQSSKVKLDKKMNQITDSGVKVHAELRMGNTFHGIQQVITEHQAYLVVMGTEGHSRLEEMMGLSNTEQVVHHSHCPVLTIHERPVTTDFKNIVYAISLVKEETSCPVLHDLQKAHHADLNLVWINTPEIFRPDYETLKAMQYFADAHDFKNYALHVYNDYTIESGILHFTEGRLGGLIAMTTHERNGFGRLLAGNVAANVSRKANCPILTWLVP